MTLAEKVGRLRRCVRSSLTGQVSTKKLCQGEPELTKSQGRHERQDQADTGPRMRCHLPLVVPLQVRDAISFADFVKLAFSAALRLGFVVFERDDMAGNR